MLVQVMTAYCFPKTSPVESSIAVFVMLEVFAKLPCIGGETYFVRIPVILKEMVISY